MNCRSKIWTDPPSLALPDDPAFLSHCDSAWLAYETAADIPGTYALVRFDGVVDYHFTSTHDEALVSHPYAKHGLKCYEFNELFDTTQTKRWPALNVRHFVVTFKNVTIDIVSGDAVVLNRSIQSDSSREALRIGADPLRNDAG